MEKITVDISDEGKRLDLFLAFKLNSYTRSFIKKQIESGNVQVNNVVEYKPNYRVKASDNILTSFEAEESGFKEIVPQNINLKIIYEDDSLVVVDKPVGMVVHPATANWDSTLLNALVYRYKSLKNVGEVIRSGLIHRLDKDTSGVVLVGKTNQALWYYSNLFTERKVEKTYLAVVKGDFAAKMGHGIVEVDNYLGRSQANRKKFSKVPPSKGKRARTKTQFLQSLEYQGSIYSLVEVFPLTGRTHQIRVHLSGLGFPILGDRVYGRGNNFHRLMLHAWKLKLVLLSGEEKTFVAQPDRLFHNLSQNGI